VPKRRAKGTGNKFVGNETKTQERRSTIIARVFEKKKQIEGDGGRGVSILVQQRGRNESTFTLRERGERKSRGVENTKFRGLKWGQPLGGCSCYSSAPEKKDCKREMNIASIVEERGAGQKELHPAEGR